MKLAVVTGSGRCDFVYYLGKILSLEKSTIVIDNSKGHELMKAVSQNDHPGDHLQRGGVNYLCDIAYSAEFYNKFDEVLVYDGEAYGDDRENLEKASLILVMPDTRPDSLKSVRGKFPEETAEYILRDTCGRLTKKAAAKLLDIPEETLVGGIPLSDTDYAAYLSLLYDGRVKLSKASPEMKEALEYAAGRILEMEEKQAAQLMKKVVAKV